MMQILKFNPITKDRLFYNRYQYCISFRLDEINCLRELDHDYIDTIIARRRVWREVSQQRWIRPQPRPVKLHQTIMTHRWKEITERTVQKLHELADILIKTSIDFKLVTGYADQGWLYTNSISLIKRLSNNLNLEDKTYTKAIIDRPTNTIKLKNPNHNYRSYFKGIKLSESAQQNLKNFYCNQTDKNIRFSPALIDWFNNNFHRTQDYFFIDYNEESWLTMISLIQPGIIRKTIQIIPG